MNKKIIYDYKTFIEYLKKYDLENIDKYINLIEQLQKKCTHDLFYLSSYVLERMRNKQINNKFVYFKKSLVSNISKLNKFNINSSENIPVWFNQNIKEEIANDEEIKELDNYLNLFN